MPKLVYTNVWNTAQILETYSDTKYTQVFSLLKKNLYDFSVHSYNYKTSLLTINQVNEFKSKLKEAYTLASWIEDDALKIKIQRLLNRKYISREEYILFNIDYELASLTEAIFKNYEDLSYNLVTLSQQDAAKLCDSDIVGNTNSIINTIKKLDFQGATQKEFIVNRHIKLTRDIKNQYIKALRTGKVDSVLNYLTKTKNINSAYTKLWQRNNVSTIINVTALDTFKKNKKERYRFNAVVDERTTATCLSLNGSIFNVDEAIIGVNMPPISDPIHPCRSYITPVE